MLSFMPIVATAFLAKCTGSGANREGFLIRLIAVATKAGDTHCSWNKRRHTKDMIIPGL